MRRSRGGDDVVSLHQPFKRALRGFNRRQVLEHLESLDGRIAMLAADRDAALTQVAELSTVLNQLRVESELRREADKAKSHVGHILATPMAEASARIQRIMQLAEEEAAETKAHAEAEATARIARADQDIADLKTRADDQITGLRARASREAQSLLEHARRQCDQLEAESAARRETAERAVEQDESELRELRAQVAREVAALEASRTEIHATVAATHQLLAEAIEQIRGVPADRDPVQSPLVPIQRTAEGGTVYLLNTRPEDRRLPH